MAVLARLSTSCFLFFVIVSITCHSYAADNGTVDPGVDFKNGSRLDMISERLDRAYLRHRRQLNESLQSADQKLPVPSFEQKKGFWRFRYPLDEHSYMNSDVYVDHDHVACVRREDRVRCTFTIMWRQAGNNYPAEMDIDSQDFRSSQQDIVFRGFGDDRLEAWLSCRGPNCFPMSYRK